MRKIRCSSFGCGPCSGIGCDIVPECRHEDYVRRTCKEEGVTLGQYLEAKRKYGGQP